ncbi:D-serine ammonia-lyase [Ideonella livida]|uniref:Probable D-serine dehydratase n=1 Tax=Ideonella livida TaxID=2707176 RepID=A0A7C9PI03_9BURK|nr:D-serine ammonia-lyase [Ideonella livida]NDY92515.1 D-serine ammonia-lyase [Ideonella livida]
MSDLSLPSPATLATALSHPLVPTLRAAQPTLWRNPALAPTATALGDVGLGADDVAQASARLRRFAPYLALKFPATVAAGGLIESPVQAAPALQAALGPAGAPPLPGRLWLKLDSHLPVSGSIKARGGLYEVLHHAERLALDAGLLRQEDDYRVLDTPPLRALFAAHQIAVGSTGNLGLSIGLMGATLGFRVTVHMSADARQWKKDRLRAHGVTVVEHRADYGAAVAEGRRQAEADPRCHFIDDENSRHLFLGYAVAAERLAPQLAAAGVVVDAEHPLHVHLPCGVGGGPGGVAFGLKLAFGDAVHCWFAEPTRSPCMLLGMLTGLHEGVSVRDIGLDNVTAADGLAVARPSGFVGRALQRLIDGVYTVDDAQLFRLLALTEATTSLRLEPSALAGVAGMGWVAPTLSPTLAAGATHLAWATGGSMVPEDEMAAYLARGRALLDG